MTLIKQRPQFLVAGLAAIAIVIVAIFAFSGGQMGAAEEPERLVFGAPPTVLPPNSPPADSAASGGVDGASFAGSFEGVGPYTITGQATVLDGADGERTLRLTEDFSTNRGPQLVIYLRAESGEFVNLGDLQSLSGEQDFQIPADVDLTEFSEVQVWCEPFGINFGSAFISAA